MTVAIDTCLRWLGYVSLLLLIGGGVVWQFIDMHDVLRVAFAVLDISLPAPR